MKRVFNRSLSNLDLLIKPEFKQTLPILSLLIHRRGGKTGLIRGGPPKNPEKTKEWAHKYYKWNYEQLPTQTILDKENPQFAIRQPEFKLPKTKGRLSRKIWRQRIMEIERARLDPELEKLARNRQLMVSIEDIEKEWLGEFGLIDINNISKYYGINRDIFGGNDFIAKTMLDISFNESKIHRGNIVEPAELLRTPTEVSFKCSNDLFTTLVLSNLDGHPLDSSKEVLHWLVCNIPGCSLSEGNTFMEYLPPLPWKGTGFHRLVFALYQHDSPINNNKIVGDGSTLNGRTFSSLDFSSSFNMIPVGLAWCQVKWDKSVTATSSLLKDLRHEPIFDLEEYIEPKEEQRLLKIQASELKFRNM